MEIWKNIPGFDYQVSNLGRVRSMERKVRTKGGALRIAPPKIRVQIETLAGFGCGCCQNQKSQRPASSVIHSEDVWRRPNPHIPNTSGCSKKRSLTCLYVVYRIEVLPSLKSDASARVPQNRKSRRVI